VLANVSEITLHFCHARQISTNKTRPSFYKLFLLKKCIIRVLKEGQKQLHDAFSHLRNAVFVLSELSQGGFMLEKHSAGENIASHCTKCKLFLDHVIVAMEGEVIAKVKCKTCGSNHKYRTAEDAKKIRTTKKKEDTVKTAEVLWEACLAEAKGKERTYDMGGKYRVGDIVDHSIFGKGVVRKTYQNKCDVLFKDKERLMASANS
jgi:hypothetical protein